MNWQIVIEALPNLLWGILWISFAWVSLFKGLELLKQYLEHKYKKENDEMKFEQERFWKFIQLSQIDKNAEIKKMAEDMANSKANDKFNDRLKDLNDTLKKKELDWYKNFTGEMIELKESKESGKTKN